MQMMKCRCNGKLIHHKSGHYVCNKCGQFTHKANMLLDLKQKTMKCKSCILYTKRKRLVFGEGNLNAKLFFIGEAPGEQENKTGIPFVGASGKLLDKLLREVGLTREDVYIANILCCRPPSNREPKEKEIKACKKRLVQQIKIINPKIICTLGKTAINTFLKKEYPISKIHGKIAKKKRIIFVSYHPAYAIYNSNNYNIMKEDFKKLGRIYQKHAKV